MKPSRKRNRRRRGRKNGKRGKRTKLYNMIQGDHSVRISDQTKIVSSLPGFFVPKSVQFRMSFPDTTTERTRVSSGVANWSYQTSAYDPDPALGTASMPGYTEWKAFYNYYRVVGMGIRGTITSTESLPIKIVCWPYSGSLITNNSINTGTAMYEYSVQPEAMNRVLSVSSGSASVAKFNRHWTLSEILGDDMYLWDDLFRSPINSSPTNMCFLLFGIVSMTGANFTSGVYLDLMFDLDVEFFGRVGLNT